jgi:hypothetical protein
MFSMLQCYALFQRLVEAGILHQDISVRNILIHRPQHSRNGNAEATFLGHKFLHLRITDDSPLPTKSGSLSMRISQVQSLHSLPGSSRDSQAYSPLLNPLPEQQISPATSPTTSEYPQFSQNSDKQGVEGILIDFDYSCFLKDLATTTIGHRTVCSLNLSVYY